LPPAELPVVVVGDVHGDLEQLFQALSPYPPDRWHTVFLGDLVDGGAFGVGALRYARDRPNSTVLLGNHEVMMLWTLRDRAQLPYWASIGGQVHDLEELARDPDLQDWLRVQPLLRRLPGRTLAQHSDTDLYARLAPAETEPVQAVNVEAARLLSEGGEPVLWDILAPGRLFRISRPRLEAWLERTGCTRLVHGHAAHSASRPDAYHDGLAINFDGGLSRYYGSRRRGLKPLEASVAPLDP
jgi:hypothetical protein